MSKLSKDHSLNVTDETVNTATHMAGAIFATLGSLLLIAMSWRAGKWWQVVSFGIYGFTLVSLFTLSALHHGVNGSTKVNRRLRTLDYVAVYALITGTITPLCLVLYRGIAGFSVLAVALLVTSFGITMRSIFHTLPSYISLTLYLCLGWMPALMMILAPGRVGLNGIELLVLGGLFYSVGAAIFGLEKPNIFPGKFGFHEIWHIAVLLGALSHFLFMYWFVLPA